METVRCAEIRAAFRAGDVPSGPATALHARGCPDCAQLFEQDALAGRSLAGLGQDNGADVAVLAVALKQRLSRERGVRAWLRSRPTRTRYALAVGGGLLLGLAGNLGKHAEHPAAGLELAGHSWSRASACFAYGSLFTFAFLVLLWHLDRRDRLSSVAAAFGALGAGLVGNLALHFHCPITHPWHLLAGHASLLLVWVACYAGWARLRHGTR